MGFLNFLFNSHASVTKADIEKGSLIDVRTPAEFAYGHHPKAVNIPIDTIAANLSKIQKMKQPIYLCCASGARSGRAESILKQHRIQAINVGGWSDVPR